MTARLRVSKTSNGYTLHARSARGRAGGRGMREKISLPSRDVEREKRERERENKTEREREKAREKVRERETRIIEHNRR